CRSANGLPRGEPAGLAGGRWAVVDGAPAMHPATRPAANAAASVRFFMSSSGGGTKPSRSTVHPPVARAGAAPSSPPGRRPAEGPVPVAWSAAVGIAAGAAYLALAPAVPGDGDAGEFTL